jgi:hypothetical protein
MNDAFLNCNIWSVPLFDQPYIQDNFYLVQDVYYYNSLESGIITFKYDCLQIPEFEIVNSHILNQKDLGIIIDFDFINKNLIPILYRNDDTWQIDLRMYEDYKLQSANL